MTRKILIVLLGLLVVLQFFRGNPPEVSADNTADLMANAELPEDVGLLLRQACYDCHSNETTYPWYSYITPVSWFLFDHVEEGRDELNFSEWENFEKRRKIRKLKEIAEQLEDGEMPLTSYTLVHGEAKLSGEQKESIIRWTEEFTEKVLSE